MSVTDHLSQLKDVSLGLIRYLVETPVHSLFGRGRAQHRMPGSAPGTLFIAADAATTRVTLRRLDGATVETIEQPDDEQIRAARLAGGRLWLDVVGFADDARLRQIGELFALHPLTLADLVNAERQTKVEALASGHLITLQVLDSSREGGSPGLAQMGIVLDGDVLLSFRERPGRLLDPILVRLDRSVSRLRSEPLDYLASALIDISVDASFPVIEALADRIDELEEQVMSGSGHSVMADIHQQRRALISLGRLFWRQRDLMARLLRDEEIFRRETWIYLRDVHDRTIQLLDMVETTRELAASLLEIHLSISANRANQIMKTLTIMASIFIPLTFVAGVYGMNFAWMPELEHPWGYPGVLLLMLLISLGLLFWFWRRGWLRRGS
jgi:magnesium transporter